MSDQPEDKPPTAYDIGRAATNLLEAVQRVNDAAEECARVGWTINPALRGTDYGGFPLTAKLER